MQNNIIIPITIAQTFEGWTKQISDIFASTLTEEQRLAVVQNTLARQIAEANRHLQESIAAEKAIMNPQQEGSIPVLLQEIADIDELATQVLAPQYKKYKTDTPDFVEDEEKKLLAELQNLSAKKQSTLSAIERQKLLQAQCEKITSIWKTQIQALETKRQGFEQAEIDLRHMRALEVSNKAMMEAQAALNNTAATGSVDNTLASISKALNRQQNMFDAALQMQTDQKATFDPKKALLEHRAQVVADKNVQEWLQ